MQLNLLFPVHNTSDGHVALSQIAGLVGDQLRCKRHDAISTFGNVFSRPGATCRVRYGCLPWVASRSSSGVVVSVFSWMIVSICCSMLVLPASLIHGVLCDSSMSSFAGVMSDWRRCRTLHWNCCDHRRHVTGHFASHVAIVTHCMKHCALQLQFWHQMLASEWLSW